MTATATREHTEAQLRAAWRIYKLPTWPASFEEAMADEQYSRLVQLHATHMARRAPPAPCSRPPVRSFPSALPPGWIDHKRAAAGDRDDD